MMSSPTCPRCQAYYDWGYPCRRCGWAASPNVSPHALAAQFQKGQQLLRLSTALLGVGALILVAGVGGGIVLGSGVIAGVLGVVGCGLIVAAAIVGTIGRAHQGRI